MASVKKTTTSKGEVRYRVRYRDPDGKSREKAFKRKADAERYARNIETDMDRGQYADPRAGRITVVEWSELWLKQKADKKPKTIEGYRSLLINHVLPAFGSRSLSSIRGEDIASWITSMKEKGMSASRVRQAFTVLHDMLNKGVKYGRLVRNVAGDAKDELPTAPHAEMLFLDHDEVVRLVEAIAPAHRVLTLTLAYSGVRWGEAAALRRRRVHVLRRQLHIAESVTEPGGQLHYSTPKSDKERWVAIPGFLAQELGVHLGGVPGDSEALVFTTSRGEPVRNSNFRTRVWRPAVAKAGLSPDLRIHDLRHTAASLMIAEGAPLTLVQRQLGHSTTVVTERYSHLYPSMLDELGERLDAGYRAVQEDKGVGFSWGSARAASR